MESEVLLKGRNGVRRELSDGSSCDGRLASLPETSMGRDGSNGDGSRIDG